MAPFAYPNIISNCSSNNTDPAMMLELSAKHTTEYSFEQSVFDVMHTVDTLCPDVNDTAVPHYAVSLNITTLVACICGIIGSGFTFIVLSQKVMRTSTNVYLLALTSADVIFLFILTMQQIGMFFSTFVSKYEIYHTYSLIFLHIALLASIWITVALAVERYIAICYPLQASNMCTIFRARCVIIGVFVLALAFRAPQFWEYKVMVEFDECQQQNITTIVPTKLSFNINYLTAFLWIVDGVTTAIIPFLALFFLNIRLIIEVRRSSRYLSYSLSTGSTARYVISREELQITVMLISIVTVFFVCESPLVMFSAIAGIYQHYANKHSGDMFEVVGKVTRLLAVIKCTLNFVLYCWFSEKFWLTFKSMFCVKYCIRTCRSKRSISSRQGSWTNGTATSYLKRSSRETSAI